MEDEQAKCIAYAWQLSIENQIIQELKQIESANKLTEESGFRYRCLTAAGGNLLTATVVAKCGGEKTRRSSTGNTEA